MEQKTYCAVAGLAAIALAMGALPSAAHAQRSAAGGAPPAPTARAKKTGPTLGDRTKGFTVGLYTMIAPGITLTGEDIDDSYGTVLGPGAGAMVGYGFNKTFSAYASLDLAKQQTAGGMVPEGSFGLAHFEIGGRANLAINHPKILPYVNAAIGTRAMGARITDNETDEDGDWRLSGGLFALGGGVQYFLSPKMALDGGVTMGLGSLNKWTWDGDTDTAEVNSTTSFRLRMGVTWRLGSTPR